MRNRFLFGIAAISFLTLTGLALAADDDHRLDAAWKAANEDHEGLLDPAQVAGINSLAFESAVARLCEGFMLDDKKYAASVSKFVTGGATLSEEEELQHLSAVMFTLGTAHGLFLAEGATKREEFCASATEQKADNEAVHNWQ
jgi:hypothetical protein